MSFPTTLSEKPLVPEKTSDSFSSDDTKHVDGEYGEAHYEKMGSDGSNHYHEAEEKDAGGELFTVKTEDCLESDSLCTGVKEMDVFHPLKLDLYRNKRKVVLGKLHVRNKSIRKAEKLWRKFKSAEAEADFLDMEFKTVGAELMELERQLDLPRNDSFFSIPSVENKTMLSLRRVTGEYPVCQEASTWEYFLGGLGGAASVAGIAAFVFKVVKCYIRRKKGDTLSGAGKHDVDGNWPAKVSTAKETQTADLDEEELADVVVSLRRDIPGLVAGAVQDGFVAAVGLVCGVEGGEKLEKDVAAGGELLTRGRGGGDSLDISGDTVYNQVNSTPKNTQHFSQLFDSKMGHGGYDDSTVDKTVTLKRR